MAEKVTERTLPAVGQNRVTAEEVAALLRIEPAERPNSLLMSDVTAPAVAPSHTALRWTEVFLAAVSGLTTRGLTAREVVVAATAVADEACR